MKLLFSEARPDYGHYVFPYAVWGFPETGETPADIFARGFLPASRDLDRYYMCRQVRVDLTKFKASSENRRILRKGKGIGFELIPRREFRFTKKRREFFKTYADIKFGKDVMSYERLDGLMGGRSVNALLVFTDRESGEEVGYVTLHVEGDEMAYYYFAFYDLNYYQRNLGIYMMTSAVNFMAERGTRLLYLGTVYSHTALYKTQFRGVEFFNGFEWNPDMGQLKHLLERDGSPQDHHLLESPEFLDQYYGGGLAGLGARSLFPVPLKKGQPGC